METTRRSFLRTMLFGGAAAAAAPIIKPKTFFSFFGTGEVWKPKVYEGVFKNGTVLSLKDIVRRMPQDDQLIDIADLLAMRNPILGDIIWYPSGERMSIREKRS